MRCFGENPPTHSDSPDMVGNHITILDMKLNIYVIIIIQRGGKIMDF